MDRLDGFVAAVVLRHFSGFLSGRLDGVAAVLVLVTS